MMKHIITLFVLLLFVSGSPIIAQSILKPLTEQVKGFGEIASPGKQNVESNSSVHDIGIGFTQNHGQVADAEGNLRPDVLYKGAGGSADIYLRKTGVSYVYSNIGEVMHRLDEELEEAERSGRMAERGEQQLKEELMQAANVKVHRVDMNFAGCRDNVSTFNEDEIAGVSNYYYAHCPQGILNVKQYSKVVCKNIYENIDVIYYGEKERGLKYDIVVNPYADPYRVKLNWSGAEGIYVNSEGNLVIKTSVNEFFESIPKVYQLINGGVIDVKARYVLKGTTVSFELGTLPDGRQAYNPEYALIIDPATWITYYGGSSIEYGFSVATDNLGNAIFSGSVSSINFPVSIGAHQAILAGLQDVFIVKMNAAGNNTFATYLGGSDDDYGYGIDANGNDDTYITGYTKSANFPTIAWGAAFMQTANSGSEDAFVAKVSVAGALIWSTYYGGFGVDEGRDIITDASNNIIFTGHTKSTNFPTQTPYQIALNGVQDAFVVKFNNAGVRQWGTYFGGSSEEDAHGITVDFSNNIYACGGTKSADFPSTSAFQGTYGGTGAGMVGGDSFLFRLDPVTGFPVWSTFYGGAGGDLGTAVSTDALGNVFLGLYTESISSIVTGGAFQSVLKGLADGALIKFTNAGTRIWGTYLGGSIGNGGYNDYVTGLAVDGYNNIVVGGDTYGTDFPITNCAYQTTFKGSEDQFISTFNQQGNLICSGYLGTGTATSPNNETYFGGGGSIAISQGYVYMNAYTNCNYPITPGAFQTNCGGGTYDAAFSKLCIYTCGLPNTIAGFSSLTSTCAGNPVNFTLSNTSCDTANTTYLWTFAGSVQGTSTLQNPGGINWTNPGTYNVSVKVMTPCDTITIAAPSYITVNNCGCAISATTAVVANLSCSSSGANGSANVSISNGSGGPYTYNWSNGTSGITTATIIPVTGLSANTYSVTITDGLCKSVSTVKITQPFNINSITTNNVTCYGGNNGSANVVISGTGGPYTYNWSNGSTGITTGASVSITGLSASTYTVTISEGVCKSILTAKLTQPLPMVIGLATQWNCLANTLSVSTSVGNGNSPYSYLWSNGLTTPSGTIGMNTGQYVVTVTDASGCSAIGSVTSVKPQLTVTTSSTNISCTTSGSASALVTSGVVPYSYSWSTGQTGPTISSPVAGSYVVTVFDGGGCTVVRTFNITGTSAASATFTQSPGGTICTGTLVNFINTGTIGTYSWTISPITPANVSGTTVNFSYTFLIGGTYTVSHTVTTGGCNNTVRNDITIVNCSGLTITATSGSVCSGNCITVTSSSAGGAAPYTYSWSTGSTTQNISVCPVFTTTYTLTVKDANGNTSASTAVVTANPAVNVTLSSTNITCNGNINGSASASVGSGSSPYIYNWNNGQTAQTVTGLSAGNYTVTITDSKNCTATSATSIVSPQPLSGQFNKGTANCAGCGCKEWIMVNAIGGTGPYSYTWPDGYTNRFKNRLCSGTYSVNVKDKNGCNINVSLTSP